jgi:hypothetical protein
MMAFGLQMSPSIEPKLSHPLSGRPQRHVHNDGVVKVNEELQ